MKLTRTLGEIKLCTPRRSVVQRSWTDQLPAADILAGTVDVLLTTEGRDLRHRATPDDLQKQHLLILPTLAHICSPGTACAGSRGPFSVSSSMRLFRDASLALA